MYLNSFKPSVHLEELSAYLDAFPEARSSHHLTTVEQILLDLSKHLPNEADIDCTSIFATNWSVERVSIGRFELYDMTTKLAIKAVQALLSGLERGVSF